MKNEARRTDKGPFFLLDEIRLAQEEAQLRKRDETGRSKASRVREDVVC